MKVAAALASISLCSCALEPVPVDEVQVADSTPAVQSLGIGSAGSNVVPFGGAAAYAFDDSYAFDWQDISATGIGLVLADDGAAAIDLPFGFSFYGEVYDAVSVAANGVVSFAPTDKFPAGNHSLPFAVDESTTFVAAHWDDLLPLATSKVVYEVVGEEPYRKVLIQWHDVVHFNNPGAEPGITFGVVLEETTNLIVLQYESTDLDDGLTEGLAAGESATIGVQESGTFGQTYSYNAPALSDGLAVLVYVEGCGADDMCSAACAYDPDCPVCVMDGDCNSACESDPDCTADECIMDGECNMACEDDPDCAEVAACIADGMCEEGCDADPDCENCEANDVCNPACASDPDCDGGCRAVAGPSPRGVPTLVLVLGLLGVVLARRKRRS